jgi:hypothetical protein
MLTGNKDIDSKILLEIKDLENIKLASDYFKNICESNDFWRMKLKKDFPLRSKYIWGKSYIYLYNNNPEELYKTIKHKKSITYYFNNTTKSILELENFIKTNYDNILRGDVIKCECLEKIKNFLWNGEKLIDLDYTTYDYGNIPKDFTFPEFPLDYFDKSIKHSKFIWLSENSLKEAIQNFDEEKLETIISDNYEAYPMKLNFIVKKNQFEGYMKKHPYIDDTFSLSLSYIFCLKRSDIKYF